jgi:uncharacterized Zn-binding protein involved in type VI secretion
MKGVSRLGGSSSHDGQVLKGFGDHEIQGKALALVGGACSCSTKSHKHSDSVGFRVVSC